MHRKHFFSFDSQMVTIDRFFPRINKALWGPSVIFKSVRSPENKTREHFYFNTKRNIFGEGH